MHSSYDRYQRVMSCHRAVVYSVFFLIRASIVYHFLSILFFHLQYYDFFLLFFFLNAPAPPDTSPLPLHDALPISFRGVPVFIFFRRGDSLPANPAAQGVSLRGLGPSGASRSLVLLDGVPLNDPFGGWVAWTKVPREGLERAELVPGGGATAWGNAALGGVVQLFTRPLQREFVH